MLKKPISLSTDEVLWAAFMSDLLVAPSIPTPEQINQFHRFSNHIADKVVERIAAEAAAQPTTEPAEGGEVAKLYCETCEGTGQVYEEHQIGIPGAGGDRECPDCDGNGYINSKMWRTAPPASQEQAQQPTTQAQELPDERALPEFPSGAIVNGSTYMIRLEDHYEFKEAEGHPLRMCHEWIELQRCFAALADYARAALASMLEATPTTGAGAATTGGQA